MLWAFASSVSAQVPEPFNSQRFRSGLTPRDGLALVLPQTLRKRAWSLHGTFGYEKDPLISGSPTGDVSIIDTRLSVALDVAVALVDRLDLFVALSSTGWQDSDDLRATGLAEPDSAGLEDPRIGLRALLRDGEIWDIGLLGGVSLPVGSEDALLSDEGVNAEGRLLTSVDLKAVVLALDTGARYRPVAHFRDLDQGSEISLRAAIHVPLLARKLRLMAELDSATRVTDGAFSSLGTPAEALLGGRYAFESGLTAGFAGALAINGAAGTPAGRALFQLGFVSQAKKRPRDDIGEGVLAEDNSDRCADERQDGSGSQPSDGCRDAELAKPLDRDGDGIADERDRCATQAEDFDGFEDEDGCQELDNDGDGVADAGDACPLETGGTSNGCPAPPAAPLEVQVTAARPELPASVEFERNSSVLTPASEAGLLQLRDALRADPELRLHVVGYASEGGTEQHNQQLSVRRAEVVRAALVSRGAPKARVIAEGRGTSEPKADNATEQGRAQNQRVEFNWDK
jgi:outer membrane protein OmpA-like peptidoglycan-associated protein